MKDIGISPLESKFTDVLGHKIHYINVGAGSPILFLHGIPTSSYLWRNVINHLTILGRCIAPDLIGFGKSDHPNITYSIHDHIKYIEEFIRVLNLKNITLVMHGLGSVIGLHYAMNHQENCRGLVFYESFIRPMNGEDISLPLEEQMNILESQEKDKSFAQDGTRFVDRMLNQGAMYPLSSQIINEYKKPFVNKPGASKPIIQYLKELPRGDGNSEIDKLISAYSEKLSKSKIPKLLLYSVPGFITTMSSLIWAKKHLKNLEIIDIGEELHLGQESSPALMGEAISVWLQGVEQNS